MIDRIRAQRGPNVALVEPGRGLTLTYAELIDRVDDAAGAISERAGRGGLVFLAMGSELDAVVLYLACLSARLPVCLVEPRSEPLVRLAKVNTEAEPDLAAKYGIRSIPTLALFKGGREVARQAGAMGAQDIVHWVRAQL